MTNSLTGFFPKKGTDTTSLEGIKEVSPLMTVPMIVLAVLCIALGLFSQPIIDLIASALV